MARCWEDMSMEERAEEAREARLVFAEVGRRTSLFESYDAARRQWTCAPLERQRTWDEMSPRAREAAVDEVLWAHTSSGEVMSGEEARRVAKAYWSQSRMVPRPDIKGLGAPWTPDEVDARERSPWVRRSTSRRSSRGTLRRGPRPGMTEVQELELYADNTEPLYRMKLAIEKNLMGKLARGQYSRKKAEKAFKHYADRAAQGYTREFDARGASSYGIFSKKERDALAKREERQFFARVKGRDPELLDMVPKKYRKKGQSCEVRRTNGSFKLDCNIDLRGMSSRRRRRR